MGIKYDRQKKYYVVTYHRRLRFPKKLGQFNSSGYNPSKEYNHEKVQELH